MAVDQVAIPHLPFQKLKALSVRQPRANAILLGKDVENCTRFFKYRGPLLIQASKKLDREALRDPRIQALPPSELILGVLIGIVTVLDCVRTSSPWAEPDAWKLMLANPIPLLRPVPCRGQIALFGVDAAPLRDVLPVNVTISAAGKMISSSSTALFPEGANVNRQTMKEKTMNDSKRPRGAGSIFKDKGSSTWRIQFSDHRVAHRESSGSADRTVAERQNGGLE